MTATDSRLKFTQTKKAHQLCAVQQMFAHLQLEKVESIISRRFSADELLILFFYN